MGKGKNFSSGIGLAKEKTVETDNLRIEGQLLEWKGVIIQVSNISLITTANLNSTKFPLWTLLAIIIGIALFQFEGLVGLVLIAIAGVVIYLWYADVQRAQNHKYLNILLNSGYTYSILFKNDSFLEEVLKVFSNIFADGSYAKTNYYIDISNCTIKNSNIGHAVNRGKL